MYRDDKLSLGQLNGLSDTNRAISQEVPPRARLTRTSTWKDEGCCRAESLLLTKGKPSTSTCCPHQQLGIVSPEHPGTRRKRRGQEDGGTNEKSEEPAEPPKRVKKEHGEIELGCPKSGHDDTSHRLEQEPLQQKTQHCDKSPQKEDVTEMKFVGSGEGRKRSYGKMEEDVKNDHDVKCRKLDHIQHGDHVHTDPLQHGDHVHTDLLQHGDHVHTDPLQHGDHVHTDHLHHGDHVHTDHLQHGDHVHTDHLQHGDHVHTDHLQHGDHVHAGPLSTDRRLTEPLKKIKGCTEEHIRGGEAIPLQPNQSSSPVTRHHSPVTNEKGYSPESHCEMQKRVGKNLENVRWRHHPYSDTLRGAQVELCKNTVTRGIVNKTRLMPKARVKPLEKQERGRDQDQFPEVTTDMEREITPALGPGPQDEILSSSFKLNITRGDMQTLRRGQWLNDEIINFYMSLVMERSKSPGFPTLHTFSTFFYTKLKGGGYRAVKRWTRTVNIFEKDIVLMPVHLDVHWTLVVIDLRKKTIVYCDPMGQKRPDILAMIFQYLQDESKARRNIDLNPLEWKQYSMTAEEIPLQLNQSDCGMFTCKYADYISRDQPITFSQQHMPLFRKRMVWEILHKCLL